MLSRGPSARRAVVLVAAVLCAASTARLGIWQLDRARQKLDLQASIESRAELPPLKPGELARDADQAQVQHYRRIVLQGRWLPERTVYLDNRQMNARQGFFVITPLLLPDGDAVLVQRGWLARDFTDRTRLLPVPTLSGELILVGRIAPPPSKLFAMAGADSGIIRQNIDVAGFARETGLQLRPLSVQQTEPARSMSGAQAGPATDDGLLRQWLAPAVDVSTHYGYAAQWFALCALTVGLTAWFQFLRARRPSPS